MEGVPEFDQVHSTTWKVHFDNSSLPPVKSRRSFQSWTSEVAAVRRSGMEGFRSENKFV